jgi:hypothetical protein
MYLEIESRHKITEIIIISGVKIIIVSIKKDSEHIIYIDKLA